MLRNLFLMLMEITCLRKRNSEIMKQECKVDSLNTCIRKIKWQAHFQRLAVDDVNCGYEESRREQVRLQEELNLRGKALWNTRTRNKQERRDMRRGQEMRVDEFSMQKIERKSCYNAGAHFTDTGLTRKGELYELFERISRFWIDLQWKINTCSQSTVSIYVERRRSMPLWYLEFVWYIRKRFWQSTLCVRFITDILSRNFPLYESKCHRCNSSGGRYSQRRFHRILWLYSKDCRYRSFSSINSTHLHLFRVGR